MALEDALLEIESIVDVWMEDQMLYIVRDSTDVAPYMQIIKAMNDNGYKPVGYAGDGKPIYFSVMTEKIAEDYYDR